MLEVKRKCKKWFAGLLGLYLDWRVRVKKKRRPLDVYFIDVLAGWVIAKPESESFREEERREYIEKTSKTHYWHGTGKLQHNKKDETVDVLKQILTWNSIRPFDDLFDFKHGEMKSISLARQRMYGRIYADMHQYNGVDLRRRYGSPSFWTYYFIIAVNLHATKELGLWNPKVRREKHAQWRQQAKDMWTYKVTKDPGEKTGLFFTNGSDIKGNFPILIGIKHDKYKFLQTAGYIKRYESRIGSNIPISNFTHLEVPEERCYEVKALLEEYGYKEIPVFALEKAERLYAERHFSSLVR
jgi:hypothetical protein